MKRIVALMMCFCMVLGIFAGCAKTEEIPEEVTVTPTETIEEVAEEATEWELNVEEVGCAMPAEVTDAFLAATDDELASFIPVAYVASKETEDGTTYRILCQTVEYEPSIENIPATEEEGILDGGADIAIDVEDETHTEIENTEAVSDINTGVAEPIIFELAMVDVLVDSDANAKIDMAEIFDLNEIMAKTTEEMNDEAIAAMADGWIKNLEQSASVISGDILMLFDNAVGEDYMLFEELSYLGCQATDDGTNFAILCYQTSVDEIPVTEMAVMFISMTSEAVEIANIVAM